MVSQDHRCPSETKVIKPVTPYILNDVDLPIFMSRLVAIHVSTGYCGAIAKHVTNKDVELDKNAWLTCCNATITTIVHKGSCAA